MLKRKIQLKMSKTVKPVIITLESTVAPLDDRPICIKCGKPSIKLCARCQRVYYCCRECQVLDWKSHKLSCISPLEQINDTLPLPIVRFNPENCTSLIKWACSVTESTFISFGSYDLFSYVVFDLLEKPVIGINPDPRLPANIEHYQTYNPYESIESEPDESKYANSTLFLNWAQREVYPLQERENEMDAIEKLNPAIILSVFDKFVNINNELLIALTQISGLYSCDEIIRVSEILKDYTRSDESSDIIYAKSLSKARTLNNYRLELSIDLSDYNEPDYSVDLRTAPNDIRYFHAIKNNILSKTFTMIVLVRNDITLNNKVPKFKFDKKLCTSVIRRRESFIFNLYYGAFRYVTDHINLIKTTEEMKRCMNIITHWIDVKQRYGGKFDINDPDILAELEQYLVINL